MSAIRTIDEFDVAGRRVLVRADLNVPMADGRVNDLARLERLAPTLDDLAGRGARVIVLSHFGRPAGQPVANLSLAPVAAALAGVLGRPVGFTADCVGPAAADAVAGLGDGEVVVLENLRFHAGEEANAAAFARALAVHGDFYVNDAFSAAHRAHASTAALAALLPAAAGRLMAEELAALTRVLTAPERPLATIVGGAKVSTKLDLLAHLIGARRYPRDRRWHGEYVPCRRRRRGWPLAVRTRDGRDRAADRSRRGGRGVRDRVAAGCRGGRRTGARCADRDGRYRRGAGRSDDP